MRILHVLAERGFSGGEHQLSLLLHHLSDRGHESTLALNPGASFGRHVDELGLTVHEIAMRNDLDLAASWQLRRLVRRLSPDLVHLACSRSHKLGAHATVALKRCPPKVVTRRMDYSLPRTPYRRWLYGTAVAAVVAVSEGVRAEVLRTGVEPAGVHLIRDGVDAKGLAPWTEPARRAAARADLGLDDETLVGLTVASLHRRKGQDVLLEALRGLRLPSDKRRLVWVLAGEGPMRSDLQHQAAALGPEIEVRFLGHVDGIGPLLAAADIFCLPSRREGLGVALLEAMAVGLPVVASAVGGIQEAVIPGQTGFLVPPGEVQALTAAIETTLADLSGASALGQAAHERVTSLFSAQKMCEKTEALYVSLAGQPR